MHEYCPLQINTPFICIASNPRAVQAIIAIFTELYPFYSESPGPGFHSWWRLMSRLNHFQH